MPLERPTLSGLRVVNVLMDARSAGPTFRVLRVAKALKALDIQTTLLVPNGSHGFMAAARRLELECREAPMERMRASANPWNHLRWAAMLLPSIRGMQLAIADCRADIVHVNGLMQFPAALAARAANVPSLWHLNDTLTPKPIRSLLRPLLWHLPSKIAFAAHRVGSYYFGKSLPPCSTCVLYPPVDPDEFNLLTSTQSLRKKLHVEPSQILIASVGTIHPLKGFHFLIAAASSVVARDSRAQFIIAGQPLPNRMDYWDFLHKEVRRRRLQDNFRFLGHWQDMPALLRAADLFVLASLSEACPTVVIEALAMGLPVVSTDVGGVRELIDDIGGHIVPAGNADALATNILKYCQDEVKRSSAASARRERILARTSLALVAKNHAKAYEDAVKRWRLSSRTMRFPRISSPEGEGNPSGRPKNRDSMK